MSGDRLGYWSIVTTLTIWVALVLAVSFVNFFSSIDRHIEEHAEASLYDVSKGINQILQTKIQAQWATLATVAKYAGDEENFMESDDIIQFLEQMKVTSNFSEVVIADKMGNSVDNFRFHTNIKDRYYFQKTMRGYNSMSQVLKSRGTGEDVFVFARPIYKESRIIGTLSAGIRVEDFKNLIDLYPFDGNGYAYIFSQEGSVLVGPRNDNKIIEEVNLINFFAKQSVRSDIDGADLMEAIRYNRGGYFSFVVNNEIHSAYYMPLGINDWYVLLGVPKSYLQEHSAVLSWTAFWLCLGIIVAFIPVVLSVWLMERNRKKDLEARNLELQWNDERFRIVTSLSNSIIFEVDLISGATIYPKGLQVWDGNEPVKEDFPNSLLKIGHVHPDDVQRFKEMHRNIQPFTKRLSGEFRLRGQDGKYVWYQIDEVLQSDEKGKAIRSIGRALNIDKEKREMEMLKAKAQIDSGSGLYNKNATEIFIKQCLDNNRDEVHAMIVMDIDDFKVINDANGHLYGDKVIEDVSNVLKHRFRSSDIIGRIGGDEFMIFMKDIPHEEFVCEKIELVNNTINELHNVSISTGVAIYPQDGLTYESLYRHSDIAMYSVKGSVCKRFEFYTNLDKN